MNESASRRSIIPNASLIDSLRKRKGWSIEKLSEEADIGMRTAQKVIAGNPVSFDTIECIATALGVSYESLLLERSPDNPEGQANGVINLHIQIDLSGEANPATAQKLTEVIAFLQRFLPDNAGICIIATTASSAIIGVSRSTANEVALADPSLKLGFDGLGVIFQEAKQPAPPPFPKTLPVLGKDEPEEYFGEAEHYYRFRSDAPPWAELSDTMKLDSTIQILSELLESKYKIDPTKWELLRDNKPIRATDHPARLFAFAMSEINRMGPFTRAGHLEESNPDLPRFEALWSLVHRCWCHDKLLKLHAIRADIEAGKYS
ncbi:helix-turn-helix domain-containing protein [Aeoliella sp.]|uniref:helix-turn-helix domain-containing protein n=1 Tax=Aeoliella sp. TaxID=2795800 RepID=UPI003CCBAC91